MCSRSTTKTGEEATSAAGTLHRNLCVHGPTDATDRFEDDVTTDDSNNVATGEPPTTVIEEKFRDVTIPACLQDLVTKATVGLDRSRTECV